MEEPGEACCDGMTYNLSQEEDVLSADKVYAVLYIGVEVLDKYTLDRVLEDQVCCKDYRGDSCQSLSFSGKKRASCPHTKLIPAPKHADQLPAITQDKQKLLWSSAI